MEYIFYSIVVILVMKIFSSRKVFRVVAKNTELISLNENNKVISEIWFPLTGISLGFFTNHSKMRQNEILVFTITKIGGVEYYDILSKIDIFDDDMNIKTSVLTIEKGKGKYRNYFHMGLNGKFNHILLSKYSEFSFVKKFLTNLFPSFYIKKIRINE